MGTSGSYGGSKKKVWESARQQVLDLPIDSGSGQGSPLPPGLNDGLAELWGTIGDALDSDDPSLHASEIDEPSISIPMLLPWITTSGGSSQGGSGTGAASGTVAERTAAGRQGSRSRRQVVRSAARGGTALGAAYAIRNADGAYLQEIGLDLTRLQSLSVPRQCGEILNAVLGEGVHPDEAALRKASLQSLKDILASEDEPDAATSVQTFVANFVFELALVELQAQVNSGALAPEDVAGQERLIRSYLDRRVLSANLTDAREFSPRDLRVLAARFTKEAIGILRARSGGEQ